MSQSYISKNSIDTYNNLKKELDKNYFTKNINEFNRSIDEDIKEEYFTNNPATNKIQEKIYKLEKEKKGRNINHKKNQKEEVKVGVLGKFTQYYFDYKVVSG